MEGRMFTRNKTVTTKHIMFIISISDILCAAVNISVLLISTFSGGWLLGDTMCQVYGILALVLVTGSTWVLVIAALERYCKFLQPLEHSSMFTETNTKILVIGVYFMMLIVCVNPLFGIGEYSYLRGKFDLSLNITRAKAGPGGTVHETTVDGPLTTESSCDEDEISDVSMIGNYLNANFSFVIRSVQRDSHTSLLFTLQALDHAGLDKFWTQYIGGSLNPTFGSLISKPQSPDTQRVINVSSWISKEEYMIYSKVYYKFQGLNMCMMDFTNTNQQAGIFTIILLILSVILPYSLMGVCYGSIYYKQCLYRRYNGHLQIREHDRKLLVALSNGSIVCLFFICPYYIVNIANSFGVHIPHWLNFISTLLLFCSGCPVGVFYITLNRAFVKRLMSEAVLCGVHTVSADTLHDEEEVVPLRSSQNITISTPYKSESAV